MNGTEPYDVANGIEDFLDINEEAHIPRGLPRRCPACGIIGHYELKEKGPIEVECYCGHRFIITKYKRGERPKALTIADKYDAALFAKI